MHPPCPSPPHPTNASPSRYFQNILEAHLVDSELTHSWPILRPSTSRASTIASSSDQMVPRFVIALTRCVHIAVRARCGRDLRPDVAIRTRPGEIHQGPPSRPRRHSSMVALHEANFADDTPRGVSSIMRYAPKWESHTGNICGYGRNAPQQQRRVYDERSRQNLREPPHQVGDRNTESLLLSGTDSHCSRFSTSAIIVPELLPVISSHLVRNPNPYPILHELPPPFRLHRFTRRPSFSHISPPPIPPTLPQGGLRNGVSISQALQLALSTGITGKGCLPFRVPTPSVSKTTPALDDRIVPLETKQPAIGNMLLSSCPGKKSVLPNQIFPSCD